MIKKFIYSTMVLSLTVMPLSNVLADPLTDNPTVITTGTTTVGSSDWTMTTDTVPQYYQVQNQGGTFTLTGFSNSEYEYDNATLTNYTQSAGTLNVTNGSYLKIWGAGSTAPTLAAITGGTVNIGTDSTTGNTLQLYTGSVIDKAVGVNLYKGNKIIVYGNDGSTDAISLYMNGGTSGKDTWDGDINIQSYGIVRITDGFSGKGENATLKVDNGSLTINGNSTLTLNNTGDYIAGGNIHIGDSSGAGTLTVNAQSSEKTYTIAQNADIEIVAGSTLSIKDGSVILNGENDTLGLDADTWAGNITMSGGSLTLDNRNGTDGADTTTADKTYVQTGGTLNLGGTTGKSELTLNTSDSYIGTVVIEADTTTVNSGGTVNLTNDSTLTLNNGKNNAFTLNTNDANTFVIGNGNATGYYATDDTTVGSGTTVKINESGGYYMGNSTLTLDGSDIWNGQLANAGATGGTLTLNGRNDTADNTKIYMQINGILNLGQGSQSNLTLNQNSSGFNFISNGTVNMYNGSTLTLNNATANSFKITTDDTATTTASNTLAIGNDSTTTTATSYTALSGSDFSKYATLEVNESGVYNIGDSELTLGYRTISGDTPTYVGVDTWDGTITNNGSGSLTIDSDTFGYDSSTETKNTTLVYQQNGGTLNIGVESGTNSALMINTPSSYIGSGSVNIGNAEDSTVVSTLWLNAAQSDSEKAMLDEGAKVTIEKGSYLVLTSTGNAVLNDVGVSTIDDTWNGVVTLSPESTTSTDSPTLTLKNVTKDFTSSSENAIYAQLVGTLNIKGGSDITVNAGDDAKFVFTGGTINVEGDSASKLSKLTLNYSEVQKDNTDILTNTNMQGNAKLQINTNGLNLKHSVVAPTSTGTNNTLVIDNNQTGSYTINRPNEDTTLGYNVHVKNGSMTVDTNNLTIGTKDADNNILTGDLTIGTEGATNTTYYTTNALTNNIYGNMALYNGWYTMANANAVTHVNGDMTTGSGINMAAGAINSINVDGTLNINNLDLKIDIDPLNYRTDTITANVVNQNGKLNLAKYNLISQPTEERYIFNVVKANESYNENSGTSKTVSDSRLIESSVGYYQMMPSAAKGAFEMALVAYKPEVFRGQVMADTIYANQLVISNQLFDRMIYSNLPYFNGECSNKTAAANTLFSPYQYTTNDTGLWFKPYGNFESIRMTQNIKVDNYSYGALIGADFKKKNFGKGWSFIPTAYLGYNGGYASYSGTSMFSNGGQAGFMGTLTKKNFITGLIVSAGGYGASYNLPYGGNTSGNGLWNIGVASKTAYNIHLPWNLILQPTVYLAYNYVGASDIDANGMTIKIDPLNAFNVAPGVNLIWQKETFSIYAMFQAMFNVNGGTSGQIANISLPQVAMQDPYFEYGLGFTKFFKERFSGYGQVVGRSGSRTGIGFQLGLNMKM